MDGLETGVIQEVAGPETQVEGTTPIETVDGQAQTEVIAKPQQSAEENAAFARMRREAETAHKEAETRARENERLVKTLQGFGYGENPSDIADQLEASASGRNVQEVKQERLAREQQESVLKQRETELNHYKEIAARTMAEQQANKDLAKVQALDPTIKSLDELGDDFINLVVNAGIDAEVAYYAVKSKIDAHKKPVPKDIGGIGEQTKSVDYYSPDEVENLTDEQLDDPKIRAIVRKSMTKWK